MNLECTEEEYEKENKKTYVLYFDIGSGTDISTSQYVGGASATGSRV